MNYAEKKNSVANVLTFEFSSATGLRTGFCTLEAFRKAEISPENVTTLSFVMINEFPQP